ncbi:MAG TPA: hypothetical protein VGD40_01040 [Chryseosolibacter sp.]
MKTRSFFAFTFLLPLLLQAQPSSPESHLLMKVADGFYHLFYDSSTAKSTVIEFEKFIALVEVPIRNEGGGATHLRDHSFAAQKVIAALEKYFPKKPLKYVLHSHWHPHSISSVKPFLVRGTTLISTQSNFERLKEFVDSTTVIRYNKQIRFVDSDSLVIKDKTNSIVVYRFLQSEYKSTPAKEYLYFYFPKYAALHSGCMYAKSQRTLADGREIVTDRVKDLDAFVRRKNLKVDNFVRINGDKQSPLCLMQGEEFKLICKTGVTVSDINDAYFSIGTEALNNNQDSLAQVILTHNIPASILNGNVYSSLRERNFNRALAFARLQVLVSPSDANAWDTLGEVNFILGNTELAKSFHAQSLKVDPGFNTGGLNAWTQTLREYSELWNGLNAK